MWKEKRMSLAHKMRTLSAAGPSIPFRYTEKEAMEFAESFRARMLEVWCQGISAHARAGGREFTIDLGSVTDQTVAYLERILIDFLKENGFQYERGSAHFKTEDRQEYEVHCCILVKW